MKRCPECRRDYYDDSLLYCLDDGAALLEGPSTDEPATAILSEFGVPPSASSFRAPPSGGDAGNVKTRFFEGRETNEDPRSAIRNPQPERPPEGGTPNAFDKRLILAPIVLAIILLGGFFGYRYFSGSNSKQISSIAVMPFVSDSGNADF